MKNILAENMLRFGVKNLHKSDIKNIEKAMVNEDVVINGTTYKFPFKDANHFTIHSDCRFVHRRYCH